MPTPRSFLPALLLLPLLLLPLAADPAAAGEPRVAVQPFEFYNAPDLQAAGPGLQAALASRLAASGTLVVTSNGMKEPDAEWIVRTTITRLGSRLSVDAALEPRGGQAPAARAFETADSADALFAAIEGVAAKLRPALSAAAPAPGAAPAQSPAATPAPAAAPALPAPAVAAPETAQAPSKVLPAAPPPATSDVGDRLRAYRVGPSVSGEARGIVTADLEADGRTEVLVLTDSELLAFRDEGKEPTLLWKVGVAAGLEPASLSAGDVDGDGLPEVFVAGLSDKSPTTRVFQWKGQALERRGRDLPAFLRAVRHPERGLLLLGMKGGSGTDLFGQKIQLFAWSAGTYALTGPFPAPAGAFVTDIDWHRLQEDAPAWTVLTTQSDILRILDPEGKLFYESPEEVKGSDNVLLGLELPANSTMERDFRRIEGKTVLWKDPSGGHHLVTQKNYAPLRLFRRSIAYTHGQMEILRWEGLSLVTAAESVKIPGYFADIDLGPSPAGGGRQSLYAALVEKGGFFSSTKTSRLVIWDL